MEDVVVLRRAFRGGNVEISGFKHSFVSVVAGCLAARGRLVVHNTPDILERHVLGALLRDLACQVETRGDRFKLDCRNVRVRDVDPSLSRRIHGSMYLMPALVAACGWARHVESGGCAIGDGVGRERPIAHLMRVMSDFGVDVDAVKEGVLGGSGGRLRAADVDIQAYSERPDVLTGPFISGATKAALICAAGVETGASTTVRNPYPKPDVVDLTRYLDASGFVVDRQESHIRITKSGPAVPVEMHITPDLSEIMTYLTLSVLTGQPITLSAEGMVRAFDGLAAEREILARMGIALTLSGDSLTARATGAIRSVDIDVTSVGIYSDHQPFFALLLTRGDRPATIREFVWRTRFDYVEALEAFGARVEPVDRGIRVHPSPLSRPSGPLAAYDLRMAGMLVVASLAVGGGVALRNMGHLDRGYSAIWRNLERMGASFERSGPSA